MYNKDILSKVKKIHFVGIGGSGMCPMAEILNKKGFILTGSDIYESDTLQRIKSYNIPVFMEHKKENIAGAELVVYSAAIKQNNPELIAARENNIPIVERSVMLGMITKRYKNFAAISGTHGKTTTTAMLTQILMKGNVDPTSIIGGTLPYLGGNSLVGKSDFMVCEACEYVDTFLHLNPYVAVILNIDADHLDYFGTLENLKNSFTKFANQTSNAIIVNSDDKNTMDVANSVNIKKITFGITQSSDYYAKNLSFNNKMQCSFNLVCNNKELCTINLKVPGKHNVYNALAAATVAHYLGISCEDIKSALEEFSGVHRRFEILGSPMDIVVADDFAHHPTELKAVLTTATNMEFNRVFAVFQPHTYSRTSMLLDEFANALSIADKVVISEILAVRENNIYNITSQDLGKKINDSICIDSFENISDYILQNAKPNDLVLTIGGGNIYKCANMILQKLKNKENS